MPRPCTCDKVSGPVFQQGDCRLCFLYHHSPAYRTLWEQRPAPRVRIALECIHMGKVTDRLNCACPRKWVRECDELGTTTLEKCLSCEKYEK